MAEDLKAIACPHGRSYGTCLMCYHDLVAEQAETIEQLRAAIQWVVADASYKPPEQIDAIVTERWIARLRSVLQSESRDG